ncbi:MAG: futalosine hydrolase [Desulfobulbus sp.]|jgi:futalosine hydrolase
MLLVTAATTFEMQALLQCLSGEADGFVPLVTGVGPVEAAMVVTAFMAVQPAGAPPCRAVINFGVAGAYCQQQDHAELLDICLAEREILGDLGICHADRVESLDSPSLPVPTVFDLDPALLARARIVLDREGIVYRSGVFVTVSCTSGSRERGILLERQYQGLCENMEGAAVARVCRHFGAPLLEVRCISNLVEDRCPSHWRLREACARCGEVVARLVGGLRHV